MVSVARGNQYSLGHKTPKDLILHNIEHIEGCWKWIRYLSDEGYARISSDYWAKQYKVTSAHQLSYIVFNGEHDRTKWVLHTCHNRWCVNPDHLYLGTPKQNTQDMIDAGRCNGPKGERNGQSQLTLEQVESIRKKLQQGELGKEIAKEFKISPTTVSQIKTGNRWGWLRFNPS